MQTVLGLFLFAVLVTQAFSLQCETCNEESSVCTPKNSTCPPDADGCYSLLLQTQTKKPYISKGCMPKSLCEKLKGEKGKEITEQFGSFPKGAIVQQVECSKASVSSASLLLTVSGLLLMKFLF